MRVQVLTLRCRLPGATREGKMRAIAIAAVFLASAGAAQAAEKVTVYVNANSVPRQAILFAEGISSRMFATAGVAVEWYFGEPGSHDKAPMNRAIIVNFEPQAPPGSNPAAMAYSLPYEGVHIVVFYDRIRRACQHCGGCATILAHVLTHEITHVLQGISRHSKTGVMKASWDAVDYMNMLWRPLAFAPEDIELIRFGLRWRDTLASASQTAAHADCDIIAAAHGRHER